MKQVAVVIPFHQSRFADYERISIEQCLRVFSDRDLYFAVPRKNAARLANEYPGVQIIEIEDEWFRSERAYNRMLITPFFYRLFIAYEYILIYQPDCFAFGDHLDRWCSLGYDFVGAPWWEGWKNPGADSSLMGVGNGGFSLRRVQSFIRILHSFSRVYKLRETVQRHAPDSWRGGMLYAWRVLADLTISNNTHHGFNTYVGSEDMFWCLYAKRNFDWFRIPDTRTAIRFSMEVEPARLYEMNDRQLPFGCHAWWTYDLEFWRPKIEQFGYELGD